MIRRCRNCNKDFEHGISGNMILFCPYCRKCAGSISDYGFGPITPCDVYLGNRIIASMPTMHELISKEFGIRRTLHGRYTDLEVYHEVEEIITERLKQGMKESD